MHQHIPGLEEGTRRHRIATTLPGSSRLGRAKFATRDVRHLRTDRGQALVEFALVIPFLLIVIAGIIDFGFAFNDVISLRQGTRDGGRQAAVGKFGTNASCSLTGFSGAPNAQKLFCMTKSLDDIPDTDTRIRLIVGESGCSGSACYRVGKPVAVCQEYRLRSMTGISTMLLGKVHMTRTVFRVEIPYLTPLASAGETSLRGGQIQCQAPAAIQ